MLNGGNIWIFVVIEIGIFVFVLSMLGIATFSLVRIARHLGVIAEELKARGSSDRD